MYIVVRVNAGAKRERFAPVSETEFEAEVKEPAKQNRANKRVVALVASHFSLGPKEPRLVSGHHSPKKVFSIPDNAIK